MDNIEKQDLIKINGGALLASYPSDLYISSTKDSSYLRANDEDLLNRVSALSGELDILEKSLTSNARWDRVLLLPAMFTFIPFLFMAGNGDKSRVYQSRKSEYNVLLKEVEKRQMA